MLNVTSQYPTQTFLPPATTQIIAQVDSNNNTNMHRILFPKKFRRAAAAVTAPDGSLAAMSQIDVLINSSAFYAAQSVKDAQEIAFTAAGYLGQEYYIEISPLPANYYSILTWQSNI